MSGIDRRSFFRIVAASGAATAAAGCGPTAEKLYPYVSPPENIVPGVAAHFATVCRECPAGCGVLAKNRDGRVIKLEGNPDHPVNGGGLCIRGHAALQGLYHPDRFRGAAGGREVRAVGVRREDPRRQARRPRARQAGREDRAGDRARDGQPRPPPRRVGEGAGRAAAHRLRAARAGGDPRGQPRQPSAATRFPSMRSRRPAIWSPSAPTSSRHGSRRWGTRPPSPRCTRSPAGRRAPSCTSSRGCR